MLLYRPCSHTPNKWRCKTFAQHLLPALQMSQYFSGLLYITPNRVRIGQKPAVKPPEWRLPQLPMPEVWQNSLPSRYYRIDLPAELGVLGEPDQVRSEERRVGKECRLWW